jgi:DNA polymerase-1
VIFDIRDARRALSATSPLKLAYQGSIYTDYFPWKENDEEDAKGLVFTEDLKKLKEYNCHDTVVTSRCAAAIQAEPEWGTPRVQRLYKLHTGLSRVAASMYEAGIPVDFKKRQALADELASLYEQRKKRLLDLVAIPEFRCNPNDMRSLLFERHANKRVSRFNLPDPVDPAQWVNDKFQTISTDQSALLLLISDPDCPPDIIPIVDAYWQAQGAQKARSTYVASPLVEQAIGDDGKLRAGWNSCGTDTGRFSCNAPNLMNLSEKKDGEGGALVGDLPNMRQMYWAGPSNVMVGADFSQLELRVMAAVSGDRVLEDALASGDVYTADAIDIFGLPSHLKKCDCKDKGHDKCVQPENHVKSAPRKQSKIVHLGFQYGAGTGALYRQALEQDRGLKYQTVRLVHQRMMKRYHGTVSYWHREHGRVRLTGFSASRILDRRRLYPREPPPTETANYPIQATASDVANLAMLRIHNDLRRYTKGARLVIQLHDAFYVIGKAQEERVIRDILEEQMTKEVTIEGRKWTFPVDIKAGTHWSQL